MFPVEVRVFVECNQCPHPALCCPGCASGSADSCRSVPPWPCCFVSKSRVPWPWDALFGVASRVGNSLSTETTPGELPNFGVPTSDAPLLCTQPGRLLIKASSLLEIIHRIPRRAAASRNFEQTVPCRRRRGVVRPQCSGPVAPLCQACSGSRMRSSHELLGF